MSPVPSAARFIEMGGKTGTGSASNGVNLQQTMVSSLVKELHDARVASLHIVVVAGAAVQLEGGAHSFQGVHGHGCGLQKGLFGTGRLGAPGVF